jgi:hypothetical protein
MPDVQPDPTAPQTASATGTLITPSTGASGSPPPLAATAAPDPYQVRIPDTDSRVWARGKTAAEILGMGDQMIGALQQVATQPQYAQPYQPPTAAGAPPGTDWQNIKDDDVVDGRTIKQLAGQFSQALQANQGNPGQQAQMAYDMVKREPKRADLFASYEPEILMELRNLTAPMWTLDNIRTVTDVIGSRHLDELADRRANVKLSNMQGLPFRADGLGAQSGNALESDGLPTNFQEILSKKGLNLGMVRSFCASNDMTVKKWFEMESKMAAMGSN